MVKSEVKNLDHLIAKELQPFVKKIDEHAFYAKHFLQSLGKEGFFSSTDSTLQEVFVRELHLIEATAKTCMTTAFCLWCHVAALTYIRNSENDTLQQELLPLFENGDILGGTGLSNPMKYYANLEKLHLKAKKVEDGYEISGVLPAISNLDRDHVFAFVAEVNEEQRIMGLVPFTVDGLVSREKVDYLGLNGSATYTCRLQNVFVPEDRIISENADTFIPSIRSTFVAYQIPLGFGVIDASISCIEKVHNRQNKCNQYLPIQADQLKENLLLFQDELKRIVLKDTNWTEITKLKLDTTYLTLQAVQAAMIHQGGAGYLKHSHTSRRLREAYFFANLTPTIKHLEKLLAP